MADNKSHQSNSSHNSWSLSIAYAAVSSAAAAAQIKTKTAKSQITFVERELKIKMEFEKLQLEKETAAAVAEVETLKAATDEWNEQISPSNSRFNPTPADHSPQIRRYLANQTSQHVELITGTQPLRNQEINQERQTRQIRPNDLFPPYQPGDSAFNKPPVISYHPPTSDVKVNRLTDNGKDTCQYSSDLVKLFSHHELLTTGLTQFNNKSEDYRIWKQSFWNISLTPNEEMDLFIKWLGKESSTYTRRIRSAHVNYPAKGLFKIWDRLEECYGAPEVIEEAHFRQVGDFPKLTNRDSSKLREYGDLLEELLSAKENGNLYGLAHLDAARGLHHLVAKLPSSLQEKWLSVGFKYKEQYQVPFISFQIFVRFVTQQAKIRTDPSFRTDSEAS